MQTSDYYQPQKPNRERVATSPSDSIISISSSDSAPAAPPVKHQNHGRPIIVSDDEDEDEPSIQVLGVLTNGGPKPAPAPPPAVPRMPVKATPIHIPSNNDIPRPIRPSEPTEEVFDTHGVDYTPEFRMTGEDTEKALRDLMADVKPEETVEIHSEDTIVPGFREGIKLMPHQVVARKWMKERESGKRCGGILADDMGLGKTIQTIARIVEGRPPKSARDDGYAKTTLVVCPVAVVGQWAAEIARFAEGFRVIEHHGPSRTTDPEQLKKAHVVVTSYSIVANEYAAFAPESKDESKSKSKKSKKDAEEDDDSDSDGVTRKKKTSRATKKKDALFKVKWWRIVLDEAHNIKNKGTKSAIACCALEGKHRWCLTGTPMQNNVDELYSLIKFLRIKPLNDWPTFRDQISEPIKKNRPQRAIKRLHVILNACMLRRTKNTVLNGKPLLDLPDRIVNNVHCEFDPEEREFYNNVQAMVDTSLDKLQSSGEAMSKNYTSMLVLLLRLRQACNHPSLVSKDYRQDKEAVEPKAAKDDDDVGENADDLADMMGGLGLGNGKRCQMCQATITSSNKGKDESSCSDCEALMEKSRIKSKVNSNLPPSSAKIRKILELLRETEERGKGEKTIIFSQFTSMLDIVEPFLKAEGIRYVRYDGSMNKVQRDDALERIKTSSKYKVILISFKAGSTGLNLTCCNNVILVDLWWNPALEDQAFDRAHRLGQTRDVNIHKLSIPDTVETRILDLQEKKRTLAAAALAGDKLKTMKLGIEDLMSLFRHNGMNDDDD
ncbi:hypothetical protein NM688_g7079 [Phlebia brevispora]|uniref:Uncharacterized protein n=1 Tax=Phlebia brevispora TaxID=194682 RepID=A0ACC1S9B1_9APHY|nr:hypothetical protein NM688_g7079 [Phlebia brevispora]